MYQPHLSRKFKLRRFRMEIDRKNGAVLVSMVLEQIGNYIISKNSIIFPKSFFLKNVVLKIHSTYRIYSTCTVYTVSTCIVYTVHVLCVHCIVYTVHVLYIQYSVHTVHVLYIQYMYLLYIQYMYCIFCRWNVFSKQHF